MVDLVRIKVKAGSGGDGTVSWHHEKFKPMGGPDGGNGGNGGSIFLVADPQLWSLTDLKSQTLYKAHDGKRGGKSNCTGKGAEDLVIKVPVGTEVKLLIPNNKFLINDQNPTKNNLEIRNSKLEIMVADLVESGEKMMVAQGGMGGRGNATFVSSTHQRPTEWTPGTPGEEKELVLELKILADIGLIGLPSSGKSSLLNALTGARAAVGAYPFTTLEPNLGVLRADNANALSSRRLSRDPVTRSDRLGPRSSARGGLSGMTEEEREERLVIADLPGLIAGAAKGKGLGDEFLKHVERCKVLVHLVETTEDGRQMTENYRIVRDELAAWSKELAKKPEIVVISKVDLITENRLQKRENGWLFISTKTGEGLAELVEAIIKVLKKGEKGELGAEGTEVEPETKVVGKTFTIENLPNRRIVFGGP